MTLALQLNFEERVEVVVVEVDNLALGATYAYLEADKVIESELVALLLCDLEHQLVVEPTLSEMIIYRMHEMNLTQKELSKILEITAPRLSEILNGRKNPTYKQAQKIATTLKIDANIVLAV